VAVVNTSPTRRARVGILYAGHRRYWEQFPGSREATVEGAMRFKSIVEKSPVEVVMTDLVDTTELSFAEFSVIDFERNEVYVGHDGPHDLRITDGRPSIVTTHHARRRQP
jgi:hypothetical protein